MQRPELLYPTTASTRSRSCCMTEVGLQVLCFLLFWLLRPPGLFEPPCCDLPLFLYSLLSFWVLPVSGTFWLLPLLTFTMPLEGTAPSCSASSKSASLPMIAYCCRSSGFRASLMASFAACSQQVCFETGTSESNLNPLLLCNTNTWHSCSRKSSTTGASLVVSEPPSWHHLLPALNRSALKQVQL